MKVREVRKLVASSLMGVRVDWVGKRGIFVWGQKGIRTAEGSVRSWEVKGSGKEKGIRHNQRHVYTLVSLIGGTLALTKEPNLNVLTRLLTQRAPFYPLRKA